MDDANDYENSAFEAPDDTALYLDCIRLVEGGLVRRFETTAAKFDILSYELNNGPSKPLLFYAIEHNDEAFVRLLLDMELPLDKKYLVSRFSLAREFRKIKKATPNTNIFFLSVY